MSTDTTRSSFLRDDRKTVTQLLSAAERDTDAVSVFMAGCTAADTEVAIFVVKGPEQIAYLRSLCERQGLLTDKAVTAPSNVQPKPNGEAEAAPQAEQQAERDELDNLLSRFERHAQRFGELWERCQGKGWPTKESDEFTALRDDKLPALKKRIRAALAAQQAAPQADQQAVRPDKEWQRNTVKLTAAQLAEALEFVAPDYFVDDEQHEHEVCISWAPDGTVPHDEGGFEPAGYVVWLAEYPEEGCMPLDGQNPTPHRRAPFAPAALAAQQAEREPLTDEQIDEIAGGRVDYFDRRVFARAVERAHGIGKEGA